MTAALAATAAAPAAAADWLFNYSFATVVGGANTPVSASGILTTTDVPVGGAYTITGITGSRTFNNAVTNTITGLLAPGAYAGNDNRLFFPGPNFLNINGFSFTVDGNSALNGSSSNRVNVFRSATGFTESVGSIAYGSFTASPVTPVTAVPEPSTWAMMLGGLGALAWWSRRRGRQGPADTV